MKKILFLFSILLAMASCISNPTYVEQDGATLKTIKLRVNANEWSYTQQGTSDQIGRAHV